VEKGGESDPDVNKESLQVVNSIRLMTSKVKSYVTTLCHCILSMPMYIVPI